MTKNGTLHARIVNIHDVESRWNNTIDFIPRAGEIVIYDADDNFDYARFKIGDGITDVKLLPFVSKIIQETFAQEFFGDVTNDVIFLNGGNVKDY